MRVNLSACGCVCGVHNKCAFTQQVCISVTCFLLGDFLSVPESELMGGELS